MRSKLIVSSSIILAVIAATGCSREFPASKDVVGAEVAEETQSSEDITEASVSTGATIESTTEIITEVQTETKETKMFLYGGEWIDLVPYSLEYEDESREGSTVGWDGDTYVMPADLAKDVSDYIEESIEAEYNATKEESEYVNLLEEAYKVANEEQKKKLDELKEKDSTFGADYQRAIKEIMGEIAPDAERLTYEKVLEVLKDTEGMVFADNWEAGAYLKNKFNEIAGAPDYTGGSGMDSYVYYLDEDKKYIDIAYGVVVYFDGKHSELIWMPVCEEDE